MILEEKDNTQTEATVEKKRPHLILAVVIVLMAILIAIGFFFYRPAISVDRPPAQPTEEPVKIIKPKPKPKPSPVVPTENILEIIKEDAELSFARISDTTPIKVADLPLSLQKFITAAARSLVVEEADFVDGRVGHKIVYRVPATVLDTYQLLKNEHQSGDFEVLSGTGKIRVSFLELASEKYEVMLVIHSTNIDGTEAIVIIETQAKSI